MPLAATRIMLRRAESAGRGLDDADLAGAGDGAPGRLIAAGNGPRLRHRCNTCGESRDGVKTLFAIPAGTFTITQNARKGHQQWGGVMALELLTALGVATTLNMGMTGDGRPLDAVGQFADALALTRACPRLTLQRETVAMALARAGVRIAPMMPEIGRLSQAMEVRYVHLELKQACSVARQRYGEAGSTAAGFLADRALRDAGK
jgi:hypothetical protein